MCDKFIEIFQSYVVDYLVAKLVVHFPQLILVVESDSVNAGFDSILLVIGVGQYLTHVHIVLEFNIQL